MDSRKGLKKVVLLLAIVCCVSTVSTAFNPFELQTALSVPRQKTCAVSVAQGEVLEFSSSDLELRTGMQTDTLKGISITGLPPQQQGQLVLDGVEVSLYQNLSREEIDRLCFVPFEDTISSHFTFIPQGGEAVSAMLSIQVVTQPQSPPKLENASYNTIAGMMVQGQMKLWEPKEDVQLQITQAPQKGEILFDGTSFRYIPYKNVNGRDVIGIRAVDSLHQYSDEALLTIQIEKQKGGFAYADMSANPSAYAATKLHQNGILSGRQVGGKWFFSPNDSVTRQDFLVMLLAATGKSKDMPAAMHTGLPNDSSFPLWLKSYIKQGLEQGILSKEEGFEATEIPTRAEAVVWTHRASAITDVKDFPLTMADAGKIPQWAQPSYKALAAYKMLDLHTNNAMPQGRLTNAYAADLLWQLWKHTHR